MKKYFKNFSSIFLIAGLVVFVPSAHAAKPKNHPPRSLTTTPQEIQKLVEKRKKQLNQQHEQMLSALKKKIRPGMNNSRLSQTARKKLIKSSWISGPTKFLLPIPKKPCCPWSRNIPSMTS